MAASLLASAVPRARPNWQPVCLSVCLAGWLPAGSFDKTAKLWDAASGENLHTYKGHSMEIVCISIDPTGALVATGACVAVGGRAWWAGKGAAQRALQCRGRITML